MLVNQRLSLLRSDSPYARYDAAHLVPLMSLQSAVIVQDWNEIQTGMR
jgi:hypothetical protein